MLNKFFALSFVFLTACASSGSKTKAASETLDSWLNKQEALSFELIQRNISPVEPKVAGGPKPERGIIVAGLAKKDPDYYFHWIRDSANVMSALVIAYGDSKPQWVDQKFLDFLKLSARLQKERSQFGMGEPRYTVEAKADTEPWSRPQYDGPALRALAITQYLDKRANALPADVVKLARNVLKTDLDFVASIYKERGFDIWEEYRGENYNTRLAQLSALEHASKYFKSEKMSAAIHNLAQMLDDHWDPARGFLRSQLVILATDEHTTKKTDLDSAVIVTIMDADRAYELHSVLDPRAQATVQVLTNLFTNDYPINRSAPKGVGPGYGRYLGDSYFGGNPWPLITAYYASFYYRLAHDLLNGATLRVLPINVAFINDVLPPSEAFKPQDLTGGGIRVARGHKFLNSLVRGLTERGDEVMRRLQVQALPDGDFYEQFDKVSGAPVSARGLAWAHASFLAANAERKSVYAALGK